MSAAMIFAARTGASRANSHAPRAFRFTDTRLLEPILRCALIVAPQHVVVPVRYEAHANAPSMARAPPWSASWNMSHDVEHGLENPTRLSLVPGRDLASKGQGVGRSRSTFARTGTGCRLFAASR